MKKLDPEKISKIKEVLKEANKLLDEYLRKESESKRDEKLKEYTRAERLAYWAGQLDARGDEARIRGF